MRAFDSLIKDLEEEGTRIVFNIEKFKKALERPQRPKLLNLQVWFYICMNSYNNRIPPLGKIAKDLGLGMKEVKEVIEELKYYGVLEDNSVQYVSLQEADWRRRQIELIKKQVKEYKETFTAFLSNFERTHTRGRLNNIEMDFMITAKMAHNTLIKAHKQYGDAINAGDREACQQAHHFIKVLTDWFAFCDPKIDLMAEGWAIKDIITGPKLIYF